MPKQPSAKTATKDEADPRFEPLAKAFGRTRGFSLMESKSRGTRGLILNGKSFGMSSHGRLILKMNEARAGELIAAGVAKPFSPSAGKVMKGWLEVAHPKADWLALAKVALALAAAGAAKSRAKAR